MVNVEIFVRDIFVMVMKWYRCDLKGYFLVVRKIIDNGIMNRVWKILVSVREMM